MVDFLQNKSYFKWLKKASCLFSDNILIVFDILDQLISVFEYNKTVAQLSMVSNIIIMLICSGGHS